MNYLTGAPLLDDILGGNIPTGVTEIYGGDSTGKTCLGIAIAKEAKLRQEPVAFINQENRAAPEFIRQHLGDDCIIAYPRFGEAAIETAYHCLKNGVKVVVIDTTDAIVPLLELELPVGERAVLAQRRLVFHGFKVLSDTARKMEAAVVTISQIRSNPKVKRRDQLSSFHKEFRRVADCVIELKRESSTGEYGVVKFVKIQATVKRLLQAPPLGSCGLYLWPNYGFDRGFELFRKLLVNGVLERKGAYWKGAGVSLGPGYDAAREQMNEQYTHYLELLNEQNRNG